MDSPASYTYSDPFARKILQIRGHIFLNLSGNIVQLLTVKMLFDFNKPGQFNFRV